MGGGRQQKGAVLVSHGVAARRLPDYLGWHWARDGGRVNSVEQLLRIGLGVINS